MADEELFIGFDHVAYATRDTDGTITFLCSLGFRLLIYRQELEKFHAYISKMASPKGEIAEIVEPMGPRSVVSELLSEQSATVYHTCFLTNDFRRARDKMKSMGAITITKPMSIPYPATDKHATYVTSHMFHAHLGVFEITGPVIAGPDSVMAD